MKTVTIKAKKDLYNNGKCFSKGKEYTFNTVFTIVNTYSLIYCTITNDMGEPHIIGGFYKYFTIIH